MENIIIKKSKTHGKGVFAQKNFKKDETILQIDDTHIVIDQTSLPEEDKNHCDYLGDKTVLMQSPEVYINHSCEPNTYVKTINGLRYVLAMQDVRNGEEITYDYAINGYYDSRDICHCGSKKCRGTISPNFFELPVALQRKYLPYLDEWFIKKFQEKIYKLQKSD